MLPFINEDALRQVYNSSVIIILHTSFTHIVCIHQRLLLAVAEQLAEIRNVTLARIFCDNGNHITQMQPNVFRTPQAG